jgi:hypothetical protein
MKQLVRKIKSASQSCVGFPSKIGFAKDKTGRLVRKVFPSRPVLGLFITGVLAIEVVAISQATYFANAAPDPGKWGTTQMFPDDGYCQQTRKGDTCRPNGLGEVGGCDLQPTGNPKYKRANMLSMTACDSNWATVPTQSGYTVAKATKVP